MIEKKYELGKLLFANAGRYTFVSAFLCAFVGLATSVNTFIKQRFFEEVEALSGDGNLKFAVAIGIFWGIFTLLTLLFQGVSDVMMEDLGNRLGGIIGKIVNKKAAKIEPVSYEDTEVLNLINKAYQGVDQSAAVIRIVITLCSFYIPYFLFFLGYVYFIHPMLSLTMLLVLVPTLAAQYLRSKYYTAMEDESAPLRRKMDYYRSCITEREYARETRVLGATYFFRSLYQTYLLLFKKEAWKTEKKSSLVELGLRALSLAAYVMILFLMYYYLRQGILGVAAFVAILTSIDQAFNQMDYVGYNIGDISSSMPAVINAFHFLSLPERTVV